MKEDKVKEIATDEFKEKYGKVYRVTITLEPDDETTQEFSYLFKKPVTASYDRYVKGVSQSPTKAMKTFVLDNIVPEQKDRLEADLEEYPAMVLVVGEKLLGLLGLSKDVNLKQL